MSVGKGFIFEYKSVGCPSPQDESESSPSEELEQPLMPPSDFEEEEYEEDYEEGFDFA